MGGVLASSAIHDAFMVGPPGAIELFHGYTYSAHPLACAAGIATLDLYKEEDLFARARANSPHLENALHALKGTRHVVDIRNQGMVGAVELEPRAGAPGARAFEAFVRCFERNVLVRQTGDIVAIAPALIAEPGHIDQIVATLKDVLGGIE